MVTPPILEGQPQMVEESRQPFAKGLIGDSLKQDALDLVKRRYNISRRANTLDFERFARFYKLFRNKQIQRNYLGLANLFVPEPYRIVHKKTAKLANAIRGLEVIAEGPQFKEASKIGTHLLSFLRRKMNWYLTERTAIQESRIIGLSWIKLVWNLDREEQDKPWRGFDMTFHPADQILVNTEATISQIFDNRLRYLIHVYEADIETLKLNQNFDSDALKMLELRGGAPKVDRTQLEMARINWVHTQKIKEQPLKKFKIYEYWGKFNPSNPRNDKQSDALEEDWLIVVADNSIVLRASPNPYAQILDNPIPYVPIVANPIGEELYPIGDIEPAESLFNELNDTRNQRMDTVTMNIDPPKEILRSAGVDERELVVRRGWYWHSNIPNGVAFKSPDLQGVRAAIEEEKVIRGDIQQVTGSLDLAQGSEVQGGVAIDTARGAIIAKGEADVVTADDVELLKTSMRMLYRIVLAYAQVFLDRKFTIRVVEEGVEQFYDVDRTDIQGNLDLDINMKTLQDKTTEQQMALLLFNQAKTIPGAKMGKFFTDLLNTFKEHINVAEYYEDPQPSQEAPKVSISLKGDLNPAEIDEIYKSMGLNPQAADPLFRQELRDAMRGELPEHHDRRMKQIELLSKQKDILASFDQHAAENNGQINSDVSKS